MTSGGGRRQPCTAVKLAGMNALGDAQREHWQRTYTEHPGMYGADPSGPARHALDVWPAGGDVLELGAGHGRDALFFARSGLRVTATDFSDSGLRQLRAAARASGLDVAAVRHDARTPLPFPSASVDGVFAHMLLSMALSTAEIRTLTDEVRRVLRPGGTFVYTVRHTGDAHYNSGIAHGDSIFEQGGFAVHFFDRGLVDSLAAGWELREVYPFEEGELPRRLWRITQVKPL
jgi:SAM-dependent methyltransferase